LEESSGEEYPTAVIDLGSGFTKCGLAGEDYPKSIFPSVVGTQKYPMCMIGMTQRSHYAGREAINKRGILHLESPIKHGQVMNWDEMENFLLYVYYRELRVPPEDFNTLITDAPGNTQSNREKFVELVFETIKSVSFFMTITATPALYASGRTSGMVLDSGHGVTSAVPIIDGVPLTNSINRVNLGGYELTEFLVRQLKYRGHNFETSAEKDVIRRLKEKFCYCSLTFDEDEKLYNKNYRLYSLKDKEISQSYKLPDGTEIHVGAEQFQVPEVMFNPALIGMEAPGLGQLVFNSVDNCALDEKKIIYSNIICAGGNTKFKKFERRLQTEVEKLSICHTNTKVEVIAPAERSISAWLGGSVLASLHSFRDLWVTQADYQEEGYRIVERFG